MESFTFTECPSCGMVYHVSAKAAKIFKCHGCRRRIRPAKAPPARARRPAKEAQDERFRKLQDRLSRGIFLLGSTVGIFVLFLMIPTAMYFKDPGVVFLLMLIELVFGTLLVCSSVSFYLLSIQVFSLQALMTFQQHNLAIFHDQIARLFGMFKRRG